MKRRFITVFAMAMALMLSVSPVFADSSSECLSLGADLSDSEKATVLELLGVDEANDYGGIKVITVTNEDEHKYLGNYIDSSKIGTKALSSVLIQEKSSDNTITVETHNITYCTEEMYRNALATAGVKGAHVVVAGPFDISGTAALVGTIKAYEEISGKEVDEDVIESSVDEIVTTGTIGDELGDSEKAAAIVAEAKKELAKNPEMSEDQIREIVKKASEEAGIELTDENIDLIVKMLMRMQDSDVDWNNIEKQSKDILKSFKGVIDSEEAKNAFSKLMSWLSGIFDRLSEEGEN